MLSGMPINVYIFKKYSEKDDKYYGKPWSEAAPIAGEGEHLTFTEKDVEYWKRNAENGLKRWEEKQNSANQSNEGNASATPF